MTESAPAATATVTINELPIPNEWLAMVSLKRVGWALAKYAAAKVTGWVLLVPALTSFNALAAHLEAYGIFIRIDPVIFAAALPAGFFMVLVAVHDYVKLKSGWKWL